MATLHISGKAKRAMNYADSSVPMYMLFSNQGTPESATLTITKDSLLGAARVTKRQILGPVVNGQPTAIYGNQNYGIVSSAYAAGLIQGAINLPTITAAVTSVYFEAPLTTDSVADGSVVSYVILVSQLQGVSITSANLSANEIKANGVTYVIEAVHKITNGITVSSNVSKTVGIIINV